MSVVTTKSGPIEDEITLTAAAAEQRADRSVKTPARQPSVIIEPRAGWVPLDLRDVWAYREVLYFLTLRDLKVRYKQTLFGIAWVMMQPLLTTLIFTIFLGKLAKVPSDGVPYSLFIFVGLLPWGFFSGSVISSGNSLVSNAHIITKVYFPRLIIPAATIGARLVDFFIGFIIFLGMMLFYHVHLSMNVLLAPVLFVVTVVLTFAIGTLASSINVKYRDVGIMLPVLMQLWMFLSPVLFPSRLMPEKWRLLYSLNPLVGIVDGFRSALLGTPFNWPAICISVAVAAITLIVALYFFRRMERGFADTI